MSDEKDMMTELVGTQFADVFRRTLEEVSHDPASEEFNERLLENLKDALPGCNVVVQPTTPCAVASDGRCELRQGEDRCRHCGKLWYE